MGLPSTAFQASPHLAVTVPSVKPLKKKATPLGGCYGEGSIAILHKYVQQASLQTTLSYSYVGKDQDCKYDPSKVSLVEHFNMIFRKEFVIPTLKSIGNGNFPVCLLNYPVGLCSYFYCRIE
jgi:hypothetical protein